MKVLHTKKYIFGEADSRHLSQEIFYFIIEKASILCLKISLFSPKSDMHILKV